MPVRLEWSRLSLGERALNERGSAAVEFLLVSILLATLLGGVLQVALALYVRNTLQDAASEGARYAALADAAPGEGASRAEDLVHAALGSRFAVRSSGESGDGMLAVTLSGRLPVFGLWGPAGAVEVTGHAPGEPAS
jgi:Flp pilus assembly protein TadG